MPNIRHELIIWKDAPRIYDALTTQEGLAAWWTPDAKVTPVRDSLARFHFGPDYFKEMKITELEASRRVKWTCLKGAAEWVGTTVAFELFPGDRERLLRSHREASDQISQGQGDSATLVVLSHDDWREYTPMFAECNYTWGRFLTSLKLLCETGQGQPWPHQHRTQR